ncbi:hypothetical protein [Mucilaginibacter sp.]|nr:hypothetical protein [Mucilaginibacter sp.]MDR3693613.1 hypothetical protein [Mucilaginibacter sp.]
MNKKQLLLPLFILLVLLGLYAINTAVQSNRANKPEEIYSGPTAVRPLKV